MIKITYCCQLCTHSETIPCSMPRMFFKDKYTNIICFKCAAIISRSQIGWAENYKRMMVDDIGVVYHTIDIAKPRTSSRFSLDGWSSMQGLCADCGYQVITQSAPVDSGNDYWFYCSNKLCGNHKYGEKLGDTEFPDWYIGDNKE